MHSTHAHHDDKTGTPDDEDGVTFGSLATGNFGTASVVVSGGTGRVVIWIDFNHDGIWSEKERVHDADLPAGRHNIRFPIPADMRTGTTYARARIASNPEEVASPMGLASDGEVLL